jgi:hypothetical protein
MLFIDYSSAFNTIVPTKLITKLRILGLNTSLCNWILDFQTGRPQVARVGSNTYTTLILNNGATYRCVLSPLLYSHDCMARHDSNTIIKSADDNCGRPEKRRDSRFNDSYVQSIFTSACWC